MTAQIQKINPKILRRSQINDFGVDNKPISNSGIMGCLDLFFTGDVLAYASETVPLGWLECNGQLVSRTVHKKLFEVIGTIFGIGDGSTFAVPDLRGRFIRGWNNNASIDPDRDQREAQSNGGITGNKVGSVQEDQSENHSHEKQSDIQNALHTHTGSRVDSSIGYDDTNVYWVHPTSGTLGYNSTDHTHAVTIEDSGGEGRPKNINLMFIIKE